VGFADRPGRRKTPDNPRHASCGHGKAGLGRKRMSLVSGGAWTRFFYWAVGCGRRWKGPDGRLACAGGRCKTLMGGQLRDEEVGSFIGLALVPGRRVLSKWPLSRETASFLARRQHLHPPCPPGVRLVPRGTVTGGYRRPTGCEGARSRSTTAGGQPRRALLSGIDTWSTEGRGAAGGLRIN